MKPIFHAARLDKFIGDAIYEGRKHVPTPVSATMVGWVVCAQRESLHSSLNHATLLFLLSYP